MIEGAGGVEVPKALFYAVFLEFFKILLIVIWTINK